VWQATIDTFIKALKGMQVSRSGRAVTISLDQKLSAEDTKEVQEAVGKPDDKKQAAVAVLDAIEKRQTIPETSLAQIVGAKTAALIMVPSASTSDVAAPSASPPPPGAGASRGGNGSIQGTAIAARGRSEGTLVLTTAP
jgi:hypothetical protein